METVIDMFAADITPVYFTAMELRVLFSADIHKLSFGNIERIRQFILWAKMTNPAPTTNITEQLDDIKATLNDAIVQEKWPT